jgi:hypothetical protein
LIAYLPGLASARIPLGLLLVTAVAGQALSRHPHSAGVGILPRSLGDANRHHTPYWSVVVYLIVSAGVLVAASGREQELVLFYAVAVFVSFLAGLTAMTASPFATSVACSRRSTCWAPSP